MNHSERLRTVGAATSVLGELGVDVTRPIDPFLALEHLQLEVGFWRLGNLLGAIVPGDESGVIITTQRGASVQRYTGAHEIAHWYLDQDFLNVDLPLDTQAEVLGTPSNERERRAQLFASYFLMPLPLLSRMARRYGVARGSMATPLQAYSIARDMHVSYEAGVRQLENCNFIGSLNRAKLLRVEPAAIKRSLEFERKPTVPVRDVWRVPTGTEHLEMEVFVGDDLAIALPENRTSGFTWMKRSDYERADVVSRAAPPPFGRENDPWDPNTLAEEVLLSTISADDLQGRDLGLLPVFDQFERSSSLSTSANRGPIGASGERRLVLNAQFAGNWRESYVYASPFERLGDIAAEISIEVRVRLLPEDEVVERRLHRIAAEE